MTTELRLGLKRLKLQFAHDRKWVSPCIPSHFSNAKTNFQIKGKYEKVISKEDNTQGVIISLKLTMKIEKNYDNRLWSGHVLSRQK